MKTKKQQVIEFIQEKEYVTAQQIADHLGYTLPAARSLVSEIRKDGTEIKTHFCTVPCKYSIGLVVENKVPNMTEDLRTILDTGDEWECGEIAEMLNTTKVKTSNLIGTLRREEGRNIVTRRLSHNVFSYQQL